MRVVFMGTPAFAATILEELALHHEVAAVYTRPDAVRGRGKKLEPSPVKELAASLGLEVRTPRTLRDAAVQDELAALEPDVICVAAYGAILPAEVLSIPRLGCLNVHASLLPRWRGAAPVERAILAGDEEAGVCIMRMEEGLDTGAFCVSRAVTVGDMGAEELTDELANLGARALITALEHVGRGHASWVEQDEDAVTYAEKIGKGELDLDPDVDAAQNVRRVRASSAAHPSRCVIAGRRVTVLAARAVDDEGAAALPSTNPGQARLVRKRFVLGARDGAFEVLELKPDGKKAMTGQAFAAGAPALRAEDARWERSHG